MPIPDFQTLMLPLLRLAGDGAEHSQREIRDALANQFGLTDAERVQLLPSGRQPLFDNRTQWARSYMKSAGLVESTGRARFRITRRGLDLLSTNPSRIDNALLRQYPEFVAFMTASATKPAFGGELPTTNLTENESGGTTLVDAIEDRVTPQERLEASYQRLRAELAEDLLDRIGQRSPDFFEQLVVDLLVAMGYGGSRADAGVAIGRSGDGGIDGIIKEDRLGLDAIYIQAKRWSGTVGRPVVQQFAGSLMGRKARKGVLISTSEFTADAEAFVNEIDIKIALIGGRELAQLMVDHGIGVKVEGTYRVYKVDTDYFTDDN